MENIYKLEVNRKQIIFLISILAIPVLLLRGLEALIMVIGVLVMYLYVFFAIPRKIIASDKGLTFISRLRTKMVPWEDIIALYAMWWVGYKHYRLIVKKGGEIGISTSYKQYEKLISEIKNKAGLNEPILTRHNWNGWIKSSEKETFRRKFSWINIPIPTAIVISLLIITGMLLLIWLATSGY